MVTKVGKDTARNTGMPTINLYKMNLNKMTKKKKHPIDNRNLNFNLPK